MLQTKKKIRINKNYKMKNKNNMKKKCCNF